MNPESPSSIRRRRVVPITAGFAATLLLIMVYSDCGLVQLNTVLSQQLKSTTNAQNRILSLSHTHRIKSTTNAQNRILSLSHTHRKLLNHGEKQGNESSVEPNRIWSEKCSKSDIMISQGATEPLPNGIPTYTVEIMNTCASGCDIGGIHLTCGWFSSARLVNPRVFKRLRFDDCLVNDGKPLLNGRALSFQYANTFRYPLAVSSVRC